MTRVEQPNKQNEKLQAAIDPLRELVLSLVPDVPLAPLAAPDTEPKRGRPITPRRLVAEGFSDVLDATEAVICAVDQVTLAAVQKMLDGMRGNAFPLLIDNKNFTDKLLGYCQQYGISLYYESGNGLRHVGIRATSSPSAKKTNPSTPAAVAGTFNLNFYLPGEGSAGGLTNLALFPQLIAARSMDQAQRILDERKNQQVGQE